MRSRTMAAVLGLFATACLAVPLWPAGSASAGCFETTAQSTRGNTLNSLVLGAAETLLPKSRRMSEFTLSDLKTIKPGRIADEYGRERLVASLGLSLWFFERAGDKRAAAAVIRHLIQVLEAYENAELAETRKDTAIALFNSGLRLAEIGDTAGAAGVVARIQENRFGFETEVGAYRVSRALIDIFAALGKDDPARAELQEFTGRVLKTYRLPEEVAWAVLAVVDTALVNGYGAEALRYYDLGQEQLAQIEDVAKRQELTATYDRLERGLAALAAGKTVEEHRRDQLVAGQQSYESLFAEATGDTAPTLRAWKLAKFVDTVRLSTLNPGAQKHAWFEQVAAYSESDTELAANPRAVLLLTESFSRAGLFDEATSLMKKACGKIAGTPKALLPALRAAETFVLSRTAVPNSRRLMEFGVSPFDPLLATGLDDVASGGSSSGHDPFPEIRSKGGGDG